MANIFCPTCGAKSSYNLSQPNFCGNCGSGYNSTFQSSPTRPNNKILARQSEKQEDIEDDEIEDDENGEGSKMVGSYFSDSTRVPKINKLAVDIDSSTDVRTFKFSEILKDLSNNQINDTE